LLIDDKRFDAKEDTTMAKDPICGMNVDETKAAATAVYKGKTYYFCCAGCKAKFEKEPEKYAKD
jgi:YHS domain-containing protein